MNVNAIGLTEFGEPDVLHTVTIPQPEPGTGQVRIAVAAAGVNPTDATFRSGGRAAQLEGLPTPYIPGMDLAGTIDALGDGVNSRLHVGDHVIALVLPFSPRRGAYTTSIVVDQESVVHAPPNASRSESATLLLNGVTATLALDALQLASGDILAITGASGAVGTYAIALAKQRGLVVATDSRAGQEATMLARGADVAFPRGTRFTDDLRDRFPDGAAGVLDTASLNQDVLPALGNNGAIASLKGWPGPAERGIRVETISAFTSVADTPLLENVRNAATTGLLKLRVAEVIPAQHASDAHRKLATGNLNGRLVLDFQDLQ
jgi:NADPH:quinone reductase-like Zn-dependent oxidoreductase